MWMGGELLLVSPPLLSRQETKLRFGNTAVNLIKVKINLQKARRTRDGAGSKREAGTQAGWAGREGKRRACSVPTKGSRGLTVRGQSRMSTLLSTPT